MSSLAAAFKEWACIVEALGAGQQILVLRKGGLQDPKQTFQMKHRFFGLFPTFEHQDPIYLKPQVQEMLNHLPKALPENNPVVLTYCAQVTRDGIIAQADELNKLDAFHGWSDAAVQKKFSWAIQNQIHVLELRVYRLESPLLIPHSPQYEGCKSWIDFEKPFEISDMQPVLPDGQFQDLQRQLTSIGFNFI